MKSSFKTDALRLAGTLAAVALCGAPSLAAAQGNPSGLPLQVQQMDEEVVITSSSTPSASSVFAESWFLPEGQEVLLLDPAPEAVSSEETAAIESEEAQGEEGQGNAPVVSVFADPWFLEGGQGNDATADTVTAESAAEDGTNEIVPLADASAAGVFAGDFDLTIEPVAPMATTEEAAPESGAPMTVAEGNTLTMPAQPAPTDLAQAPVVDQPLLEQPVGVDLGIANAVTPEGTLPIDVEVAQVPEVAAQDGATPAAPAVPAEGFTVTQAEDSLFPAQPEMLGENTKPTIPAEMAFLTERPEKIFPSEGVRAFTDYWALAQGGASEGITPLLEIYSDLDRRLTDLQRLAGVQDELILFAQVDAEDAYLARPSVQLCERVMSAQSCAVLSATFRPETAPGVFIDLR